MWALIINGVVSEVTEINPEGRFVSELEWVECSAQVGPGWAFDGANFLEPPPVSFQKTAEQIKREKLTAYQNESDPLFFKEQRGEVLMGTWLAKIEEIKSRFLG